MKVYIVFIVPDYEGIDILKIFSNKDAALKFMDHYNSTDEFASKYKVCEADWFEEDVFDSFNGDS